MSGEDLSDYIPPSGAAEFGYPALIEAFMRAMATAADPFARFAELQNLSIDASTAANALTITITTRDGSAPSDDNPVAVSFRSATLTDGDFAPLVLDAASSLVVPNGATLGTSNGVPFCLWVLGFNDAGTWRPAVVNCRSGTDIMALEEDALYSSTAMGTGSDSAQVIYSGTGVASKAMRILACLEWSAGLATAGAWSGDPTKVQLFGPGIPLPGARVQLRGNSTGAAATGTTTVPDDDTIPQNTEGDQALSQAITPTSAANVLRIRAALNVAHSVATGVHTTALFQDTTANALASRTQFLGSAPSVAHPADIEYWMVAGTASATTFKARTGHSGAGTTTVNGYGGNRKDGGVLLSRITIEEIKG